MKNLKFVLALFLTAVITVLPADRVFAAQNTGAVDLMNGVKSGQIKANSTISEEFVRTTADFSVSLFQKSVAKRENALISPVSACLALGMTANGASGNTLVQFQKMLGKGLTQDQLNQNYLNMTNQLNSSKYGKLLVANSIWYRDKNLSIKKSFLQNNADYFGASLFRLDFSSPNTASQINGWVKEHTGGKIDKMVDKIDDRNMMCLINALYFEDKWIAPYASSHKGSFRTKKGAVTANYLSSPEYYIHDANSDGMLKYFKDKQFAFAAVLPKAGVSTESYIGKMSGAQFLKLMSSAGNEFADCEFPKFRYDFQADLNSPLKALGLTNAFDKNRADFSRMGTALPGKLYIGDVQQKTFIQVDEAGVKAGAATKVEMWCGSTGPLPKKVVFNRPFVYAIIDMQTKLPVFLGIVGNPAI
jgi:Serine protease inhibitor